MLMRDSAVSIFPLVKVDSKRSKVVNELILALFKGDLNAGERLVIADLANRMNISATPIREALVELESIGIVTIFPHRGAVCNPFGPKQLSELFQLRRILEVEAVRQVCDWLSQEKIKALLELQAEMKLLQKADKIDAGWSKKEVALDIRFHELIAEYCGNGRLQHEIGRYESLMSALMVVGNNLQENQRDALSEHISIIDALLNRDKSLAISLMEQHITNTGDKIELLMFAE